MEESPQKRKRNAFEWIWIYFCGLCMGAADLVPGISGGTVAFITGIYTEFLDSLKSLNIESLKALLNLRFKLFFQLVSWRFLIVLGFGIATSVLLFSQLVHTLLENPVSRTCLFASFLGLVFGSLFFVTRQLKRWRWQEGFILLVAMVSAYACTHVEFSDWMKEPVYDVPISRSMIPETALKYSLSNYNQYQERLQHVPHSKLSAMVSKGVVSGSNQVYSHEQHKIGFVSEFITEPQRLLFDSWLIGCGVLASGAMLLPGISGSYVLAVLGVYATIIGALADVMKGFARLSIDWEAIFLLFSIGIGILVGLTLFSRVLSWLLHHHHDKMIAALIGLMVGSLPVIWPFWEHSYALDPLRLENGQKLEALNPILPSLGDPLTWWAIGFAILGMTFLFGLEYIATKSQSKS